MKKHYFLLVTLLMSLSLFAQPKNDDCTGAEFITVTNVASTVNFDIVTAALTSQTICAITTDYADVWYEFTMPFDGSIYTDGTLATNNFALYENCRGAAINCGNTNVLFSNLTMGSTYLLRVYRMSIVASESGFQSFTIKAIKAPSNDDCASAETIEVTTEESTVNFNFAGASITNEIGCFGTASDYADIWYNFTMPVNGNLYVDGFTSWNYFALYDACVGTEFQCGNSDELFTGLTAGTKYKLRLFRRLTNVDDTSLSFSIKAFETAANDDCSGAENITVTNVSSTVNFDINTAALVNQTICATTTNFADVWYKFTMPFNGNVYVDGFTGWNNFALYDACEGNQIMCLNNSGLLQNLSVNTVYTLRLYRNSSYATNPNNQLFTIQAFQEVTNDDCETANSIAVTTSSATINFEIAGADIINEVGCEGNTSQNFADIWYDFTMPVNGNLRIYGGLGVNNFALYDTCNGTQIGCFIQSGLFQNLISGSNYKLRVFRTSANAASHLFKSFTIQAYQEITNDGCETAQSIAVTTNSATVNFEITGADINNEVGCDGNTAQNYADIWYDFTMPVNGNVHIHGGLGVNNFALYNTCSGTQISCFNQNGLFSNLISGDRYKLRVFRTSGNAANNLFKSFNIQAFEHPTNDACNTAEPIAISTTERMVDFEIGGSVITNELGCRETTTEDYADIWYDFTMPEDGSITIDGFFGGTNFALYDACGGTEIACFNETSSISNLAYGSNYKLRLFRTLENVTEIGFKSFSISIDPALGISDESKNDLKIYPNPATEKVHISSAFPLDIIEVYDILGQQIITEYNTNVVNVGKFPAGVYFLKIYILEGFVSKRMIKK